SSRGKPQSPDRGIHESKIPRSRAAVSRSPPYIGPEALACGEAQLRIGGQSQEGLAAQGGSIERTAASNRWIAADGGACPRSRLSLARARPGRGCGERAR